MVMPPPPPPPTENAPAPLAGVGGVVTNCTAEEITDTIENKQKQEGKTKVNNEDINEAEKICNTKDVSDCKSYAIDTNNAMECRVRVGVRIRPLLPA